MAFFIIKQYALYSILFLYVAELCNGSTCDSDSHCEGSNPSSATTYLSFAKKQRHAKENELRLPL